MKFSRKILPVLTLAMLAVTANAQSGCYAPPAGLVSWWPGEGNALDIVSGNNGTLVGGVTFTNGEVGQAFSFGSGYVSVPHVPAWDFGTNEFTIEFWANFTSTGGAQSFISCDDGAFGFNKWIFFHGYGVDGLTFHLNGTPGNLTIGNFPFSPVIGQWYYIALTRSGPAWTFYVNGASIGTDPSSAVVPSMSQPLTIGNAEGNFYFNGSLDEVSIYTRALSSNEIAAIYAAGSAGKCSPYSLLEPLIASFNLAGTNLVINAANGVAGGTYTVLMSTNVALPLSQWTPVATNVLTGSGNFTITVTNAISPGASQQFYILQAQ
jgi:hypothetical protein